MPLLRLADLTSAAFAALRAAAPPDRPLVALLPVGSVEPHGPHLPLGTDTLISEAACRAAAPGLRAVVACPLSRRWGRTLSAEFKHGSCHAGRYETSLILASDPALVDGAAMSTLPPVPVSLAEKLRAGISDFREMGLSAAYAGAPAEATPAEGRELLDRLAAMIAGEIADGLAAHPLPPTPPAEPARAV